jgi:hypothetical protein
VWVRAIFRVLLSQVIFIGINKKKIGNTELVSTGPVRFPLGEDPSGIRHVQVDNNSLTHEYSGLIN